VSVATVITSSWVTCKRFSEGDATVAPSYHHRGDRSPDAITLADDLAHKRSVMPTSIWRTVRRPST
jgi:hypothetical protein